MSADVQGYCPMGCGETLFLGAAGYLTCRLDKCPNPTAVADILADSETQHIVKLDGEDFTIRHPLRERLGDELTRCALHIWVAGLSGPPRVPGLYRVWEPLFLGAGSSSWSRAAWEVIA